MSSSNDVVVHDFSPMFKVYKDNRIERLKGFHFVPPSYDLKINVASKDFVISEDEKISARIYIPKVNNPKQKLPLLFYIHGGAFVIETPFSPDYHFFMNSIVSKAQVIGVSIYYKRAPEYPVPIAFEDSWAALKWVASHSDGQGPEGWLNHYADLGKVFLSGDDVGATIAHQMTLCIGTEGLPGLKLEGIALVHSFFWGTERIGTEAKQPDSCNLVENLWRFVCPTTAGFDDPLINPAMDPNLGKLACKRVLVCVAEKDVLKDRGWYYKEILDKSGWNGVDVEVFETKGEDHLFHLDNPDTENALYLLDRIASFFNQTTTTVK